MKKMLLLLSLVCSLQLVAKNDAEVLCSWTVGACVSETAVREYGYEHCFVAEPIPDEVWVDMQGKTYKQNNRVKRSDLRYLRLLHWDYDSQIHLGELVCNKQIAATLVSIFRQLYEARYPIQRMVRPDAYQADDERQMRDNNTSCFCYREVAGSATLSKHARGLAVDLNPLYNPYLKQRRDGTRFVQPTTAAKYCNRSADFRYKIDRNDLAYKLFTKAGFTWGGSWRSCKDYQHFEWKGK